MLYSILKIIYKYFNSNAVANADSSSMPIKKQKDYLKSFKEPVDDYQRSYFKYKCFCEYCYYGKKWMLFLYNVGAMLILPLLHIRLVNKGKKIKRSTLSVDAVIENVSRLPNTDIIPDSVKKEYKQIRVVKDVQYSGIYLNTNAEKIYKKLRKRYFGHFYFRTIVMLKLALFSKYIEENNPKAIVFYGCEREFSGPLQTYLCELEGVRYESYMHGDYLYKLCFAFQRFSKYYVWDKYYVKLFKSLKSESPMDIYIPEKMKGLAETKGDKECKYFATYYFSNETRECAERIHSVFKLFEDKRLRCRIRPHPRFSDVEMLKDVFADMDIENTAEVALSQSISNSMYIVGLNTTVLSEAFFSGKKVVIDNISMKKQYSELKKKGYIMMSRPHVLLSDLVDNLTDNLPYNTEYEFYISD